MALETSGGVVGKVCSTCRRWKPLTDFPTDPTHSATHQGGRHCRTWVFARWQLDRWQPRFIAVSTPHDYWLSSQPLEDSGLGS